MLYSTYCLFKCSLSWCLTLDKGCHLIFCQDAWLCHFLADGVHAGRGGMKGGRKGVKQACACTLLWVRWSCSVSVHCQQACKVPTSTSICTCRADQNTAPHEHIRTPKEMGSSNNVLEEQQYKVRNKRFSRWFRVSDLTFTLCVRVCAMPFSDEWFTGTDW